MKRAIRMLGAVAALAVGFLFAAPAAHAQTALKTFGPINGVTCKQYSTVWAYPATYWDCINTGSPPTSFESVVGQVADQKLTPAMKATLANVEIMIFKNAAEFASFTGAAAPATKYMAWTAPSGPSWNGDNYLTTRKIAAVFMNASLYSPNIAPTNVIANRDISASYKIHILQALGRHYDQLTGNPSTPQAAPVHIFPIAVDYDKFWTDEVPATTVWGSNIANTLYPTQKPWQILGNLYGNTPADLYAFQFATEGGSGWSHLQQFLNAYALETKGFRHQQIFGHAPIAPVTGVYNAATQKGVMCAQYATAYNAPANIIYDCAHPYNSTASELTAGLNVGSLPPPPAVSTFRTMLTGAGWKYYVMRISDDYETYFQVAFPAPVPPAVSVKVGMWGISSNSLKVSVAFRNYYGLEPLVDANICSPERPAQNAVCGGKGYSANYLRSTLAHETGHDMDFLFGNPTSDPAHPKHAAWLAAIAADVAYMNSFSCTTVWGAAICNDPKYAGLTNTTIFSRRWGGTSAELWSHAFQIKSGANGPPEMQTKFQTYFIQMLNFMQNVYNTGAP